MTRRHESLTDALARLAAAGFVARVEHGRHLKVRWTDHAGRRWLLIVPRTPSDWRTGRNTRATVRRLIERIAP